MAGIVPYGIGGSYPYSSSSPSSLSALAPPFTVDRPVPKPMSSSLDVTEPPYVAPMNSSLHNWLPSHPTTTPSNFFANPTPDLNSIPPSNAYGYAGLQTVEPSNTNLPALNTITTTSPSTFKYDQSFNAAATSFVEAKPYYPSYLSSTVPSVPPMVVPSQPSYDWLSSTHFAPLDSSSHNDYTQNPSDPKYTTQWGGLWEWEHGKQGDINGNFCSKKTDVSGSSLYKNYMNQDPSCEEASHGINIQGWEKHGGSVSAEHLGDKSFLVKNSKFIPADVTGSFSVVPEIHTKPSSSQFVMNTTNCKAPYSVFSEQQQHDASMDDISSTSKLSSALATRIPAIGTKSSEPEIGLFKRLNFRSDAAEIGHDDYYLSSVQESRQPQVSEGNCHFSSSQLDSVLGINDSFFAERKEELSNNRSLNKSPWDHVFKVKSGLENPHVSSGAFNVALNTNETVNSFPSSSDNVDPNNPAVDSPCWKGVPGSRFSPFESSEEGVPEQIKKLEDYNGLHFPMPPIFPLNAAENASSQKPIKNTVEYHDLGWLEKGVTLPLKRYSVENSAFGEHKLDDTAKTTYDSETSHGRGPPSYRNVLHKSGNGENSFGLFGHSHTMEQGCGGEDGLAVEMKKTTLTCGPDVKLNVSDTMEYGSLHVPSHAVENILCSSVEEAPTKLSKSDGEDSMLKVGAQMLVDTMNSLSELLLSNCSYGLVQLKKNDIEAIKAVINNLHICISKNSEKLSPTQEMPSFQQNTSQWNGEFIEHNKVVSVDRVPLASASNIQDEVTGSVSVKSDKNMAKEDKMTQAIKNILSENFQAEETDPQALLYKNLWLEAEAVLCSINYKARFNRVKIEMDKCKAEKSEDGFEYNADMVKQSMADVSPDSNPVNPLTPDAQDCPTSNLQDLPVLSQEDDVLARFRILRDRVENTNSIGAANGGESSSKVSEPNKVDNIPSEVNGNLSSLGISIQDSPTSDTVGMTDDYEASVMARFRIIKDRVEKSKFISSANMEESSSSNVCLEPKSDIIAPNASDFSGPEFNFQDSSISITTSQSNDCEASVLSRFHILKSRIENYADLHTEGQHLPDPKISAVAPNTSDSLMPEINIHDSPRSSTTDRGNDCEDSVMSRLQILKSRIDNSYMHSEGQQLPETGGLGYAGMRNPWPFISKRSEGEGSELKEQPILQSHEAGSSEGNMVAAKEFHLFVGGPPTDNQKINRPGNLLPAGWYDSSSSDWEHVMKEEVWGQN
ncbi:uncharacterized protein [Pyrus communis]|uniref:uncharacterized protein isoform X1 n=1 Tax=Pyrus communis TaxID=23211 RepID=UPI0035C1E1F1